MRTDLLDPTTWPLVDAVWLWVRSGPEAIADVELPDGSLPIAAAGGDGVRMMRDQWDRYRALCARRMVVISPRRAA